jgi:hypothetical protein
LPARPAPALPYRCPMKGPICGLKHLGMRIMSAFAKQLNGTLT